MRFAQPALRIAAPAITGLVAIEAIVSILARWPYQFGGHDRRSHVLAEFIGSGGTALAPPLLLLVILAVTALAVQRAGGWRTAASVVLVPVAAVMTVGAFGEAAAPATPDARTPP